MLNVLFPVDFHHYIILLLLPLKCKAVATASSHPQVKRKLSNFNIIFTQMKQQANNPQSTTAQALTSFPENPHLYIFAYTITGILCISWNKSASWYISF
jgi:hypothetical protein